MPAATDQTAAPHIPVLLEEVRAAMAPLADCVLLDGTFGAGGYTRALLAGGPRQVIGVDRDPSALDAADWAGGEPRLTLVEGVFGDLDTIAEDHAVGPLDGVVLDIGVSSMQLDQAARGFSFMRDGPLDMRMASSGPSAADLVNEAEERVLADIIFQYGEDRASRRIAKAIVRARAESEITSTLQLAGIIADVMPAQRPGQIHPATRSFQGLRIAVNDELGELVRALGAAERALVPGGRLVVVTFHSLEDRIVKRYLQAASASLGGGSRHEPEKRLAPPRFERPRKDVTASDAEIDRNPRARSARLRSAVRTDAPALMPDPRALGLPTAPVAYDVFRRTRP